MESSLLILNRVQGVKGKVKRVSPMCRWLVTLLFASCLTDVVQSIPIHHSFHSDQLRQQVPAQSQYRNRDRYIHLNPNTKPAQTQQQVPMDRMATLNFDQQIPTGQGQYNNKMASQSQHFQHGDSGNGLWPSEDQERPPYNSHNHPPLHQQAPPPHQLNHNNGQHQQQQHGHSNSPPQHQQPPYHTPKQHNNNNQNHHQPSWNTQRNNIQFNNNNNGPTSEFHNFHKPANNAAFNHHDQLHRLIPERDYYEHDQHDLPPSQSRHPRTRSVPRFHGNGIPQREKSNGMDREFLQMQQQQRQQFPPMDNSDNNRNSRGYDIAEWAERRDTTARVAGLAEDMGVAEEILDRSERSILSKEDTRVRPRFHRTSVNYPKSQQWGSDEDLKKDTIESLTSSMGSPDSNSIDVQNPEPDLEEGICTITCSPSMNVKMEGKRILVMVDESSSSHAVETSMETEEP